MELYRRSAPQGELTLCGVSLTHGAAASTALTIRLSETG